MSKNMNQLPLEGIRVLDFGQYVAGPATAMMLGDQGAEVIRIDYKTGNRWDGEILDSLNRRKKSIALDLKNKDDLEIAKKLIMTSDILIENFRPKVMDKLGLSYEETLKLNDRLIYVSIPGFSSKDEKLADVKAWEEIIAAVSGQFTDMGLNRILMGINPSFTPLTLSSAYASVLAAMATGAALFRREENGLGDYIEVPIAAALTEGLVYNSMHVDNYPDRYCSPRELEINRRKKEGVALDMAYEDLQEFLDPFYRTYTCKDGRPVYLVRASQITHSHTALKILGLYDEVMEAGFPELDDWYLPQSEWPEGIDCALGLYPISKKWADWLAPKMKAKFLEKTSKEWEDIFGKGKCPLARLLETKEWINSEHALESALIHQVEHPTKGIFKGIGPIGWTDSSACLSATPALPPTVDGNREEILESIKNATPTVSNKKHTYKPFLDGVNILDMTNVIAGPMIAGTLVRFGPNVIKLDSVKPTFDPWNTIAFGMFAGQNKKSILADVKSKKGKALLEKLIKWADIITYNGLDDQFQRLGIDIDSARKINPKIVIAKIDAYGGPKYGPRSNYPGYDDLLQASTGVMSRFGGSIDTPEEHAHMGTIDVLAGHTTGFAAMIALYKARKTGIGETAYSSLASAGQLIQVPFMYDYNNRKPFDEPRGRAVKGWSSLIRCYEAKDGWFFLRTNESELIAMDTLKGLNGIKNMKDDERVKFFVNIFKTESIEYWSNIFNTIDVAAVKLGSLTSLRENNSYDAFDKAYYDKPTYQFITYKNHPCGKKVIIAAPSAIRPKNAKISVMHPTEKYGTSTISILKQFGYSDKEINSMIEDKVVSISWSKDYMPE